MTKEKEELYKKLTLEEVKKLTLLQMRDGTISNMQKTEIFLEIYKKQRDGLRGDKELAVVKKIRDQEANLVQLDVELEILEEALKEYDK